MSDLNTWPGWETVGLIGRGSFGAVYEIQRTIFDDIEKAALKVISIPQNASDIDELYSDGYDDESITSTFQSHLKSIVAEYSLMRKMNGSANIVNCDDVRYVQHDDGIGWDIFIKMELLTPLTKALPADIPEETVVKIAKDMCAALELCKKLDIVHRDIKPQNIFVSDNGDYKLGDFGIAKTVERTMGGTKIGTYKYMAPEVYNNQPYGSGADIYSLGLVLYWLLNERRMPFLPLPPEKLKAGMDEKARNRRLSGEPLPPPTHGSEALKQIVLKACAYDPAERYATATEMLGALNACGMRQRVRVAGHASVARISVDVEKERSAVGVVKQKSNEFVEQQESLPMTEHRKVRMTGVVSSPQIQNGSAPTVQQPQEFEQERLAKEHQDRLRFEYEAGRERKESVREYTQGKVLTEESNRFAMFALAVMMTFRALAATPIFYRALEFLFGYNSYSYILSVAQMFLLGIMICLAKEYNTKTTITGLLVSALPAIIHAVTFWLPLYARGHWTSHIPVIVPFKSDILTYMCVSLVLFIVKRSGRPISVWVLVALAIVCNFWFTGGADFVLQRGLTGTYNYYDPVTRMFWIMESCLLIIFVAVRRAIYKNEKWNMYFYKGNLILWSAVTVVTLIVSIVSK